MLNAVGYIWEISIAGPGMFTGFGGASLQTVLERGSLYPYAVWHDHEWWRIITAAFLHAGLIHIFVNMISLWSLGRFIELAVGSTRMLLIYLVSLLASGLAIIYLSAPDVPTLGASGAIFGLFGALFAVGMKLGPRGMSLVKDNIGILVMNLIITFAVPGISWQAHVGGLIVGFIVTYLIYFPPRPVQPVVVDATTGNTYETEYQEPQRPLSP